MTRPSAARTWEPAVSPDELAAVASTGAVDEAWYATTYRDVAEAGIPPLIHYLMQGWQEGRDPGPGFSTDHYLTTYPDVAASGKNPLVHYVTQGWREGRLPRADFVQRDLIGLSDLPQLTLELAGVMGAAESEYAAPPRAVEPCTELPSLAARADRPAASAPAATPLRTAAFYLPQFHPIPENDEWWGDGFTEWTNVVRGTPFFRGHHQPHVPGELGYYDLRDSSVMRRQVELAALHGISAFCFYSYWFAGKRLLEGPLDAFLADDSLDLEFLVCWANENWTRTWNGNAEDVLIGQDHSPEDDLAFIAEMSRYLRDRRYLRIDGKPLLLVYRPSLLPDPAATAARWRAWCRENDVGEIVLAYVQSFDRCDPAVFGFDYAVEFPPNNTGPHHLPDMESTEGFDGQVYDWVELAARSREYSAPSYPVWRGVCPSWDNTARRGSSSAVLWGANPSGFRDWLMNAGAETKARLEPEERLVFVNAWNEWAEGAHLEPDREHGYQWLHAVRDVQCELAGAPLGDLGPGVAVVTHDMHEHGAQMLALAMATAFRRLGLGVEIVALGDGELRRAYSAVAPLHVLGRDDDSAAEALAVDLVRRGFTTAICNTSVSGNFATLLRRAGADVTGLVHEMSSVLADPEITQRAQALSRAAHRIWFPADKVASDYPYELPDGCDVIIRPQGVYRPTRGSRSEAARGHLRRLLALPADAKVVLGVGYGDHRKGLDLFAHMAAAQPRSADGAPLHFVWVGRHDAFDPRVTEAVAAAGRDRLHLVGFVSDTETYYQGADVLALTSREDPFPSVVLEALFVGLPVVAFRGRTGLDDLVLRTHGALAGEISAEDFLTELVGLVADDSPSAASARSALVLGEFNFQRYALDLLSATPAALPRVSVVVPSYNYATLIGSRIRQVLEQTFPVYELIVLDDASTDGSPTAIREAIEGSEVHSRVHVNQHNSGSVFAQWRRGAELASGDVIWIAEADDVADVTFLADLVPELRRPGTVLAYCESRQIDSSGAVLADSYRDYVADIQGRDWTRRYQASGEDEIASCLAVRNTIPNVSAVVFDAATLRDVLSKSELAHLPTAGDWHVYVEVLRKGDIVFNPLVRNCHRRHSSSVVATGLGLAHLVEIMTMQAAVADGFPVSDQVRRTAVAYDERLYVQFQLGSAEALHDVPELAALVHRIDPPALRPDQPGRLARAAPEHGERTDEQTWS